MTDRDANTGDGRPAGSTEAGMGNSEPRSAQASSTDKVNSAAPSGDVRQKVMDDVASVRDMAKDEMSNVSAKAEEAVDRQKSFAAEKVAGIATVIEKVGAELEGQDQAEIGRMARQVGESVHRFADDIKGRSLSDIAGMAEDFGRKQPLAFLGMAAIAGLAASRFISASATRQAPMTSRASPSTDRSVPPSSASATPASPAASAAKSFAPSTSTLSGAGSTTGGANG